MTRITTGIASVLSLSLAAGLGLLACSVPEVGEPSPLSVAPDYVGAYTVSGDRIFMVTSGDTSSWCEGAERKVSAHPAESDTLEFRLDGDRLKVLNSPERDLDAVAAAAAGAAAPVVRIGWEADRVGRGSGLDGHWRIDRIDYYLVDGDLDEASRAAWERRLRAWRRGNALGVSEMEFKDGHAYARSAIRWAELFVAEWNGDLAAEAGATPDSARYQVEASLLDARTVRLLGRKSGENVSIAFAEDGERRLSSDKEGREPYSQSREPASCPEPGDAWLGAFLADNT